MTLPTFTLGDRLREMRAARGCEYEKVTGLRCIAKKWKQLEFAHLEPTRIVGRGRGLRDRYFDILRNPGKYAVMHKSCHAKYDFSKSMGASDEAERAGVSSGGAGAAPGC